MTFDFALASLRVRSELPLPELAEWAHGAREPDIHIRYGERASRQCSQECRQVSLLSRTCIDGSQCLEVPNVARFALRGGAELAVSAAAGVSADEVRPLLLGPAMAMLLSQRGLLPLRASTVARNGNALLLCGEAGVGMSETAYALLGRGFRLVADGLSPVHISKAGATALSTFAGIWLWQAALDRLGLPLTSVDPLRRGLPKYSCRYADEHFDPMASFPIRDIFMLTRQPQADRARPHLRNALFCEMAESTSAIRTLASSAAVHSVALEGHEPAAVARCIENELA